ncbi:MAG: arylesterase [Flavobacteriaceae bacterium]
MRTLLNLCYFLCLSLMVACGESTDKKAGKGQNVEVTPSTEIKKDSDTKIIVFFGNSLTAGYGLDTEEAFPALIQNKIDSLQLNYTVVNSGLSGETTTSGKNRLDWVLNQKIDVFVLELGANDGLRGIPLGETRKNLQEIIDAVKTKNPETKIILAGMQIPPNMGKDYTAEFKRMYPELAEKNQTLLIPFLLENVAGIPALNQADGIHPTTKGQKIVSDNVWEILQPVVTE